MYKQINNLWTKNKQVSRQIEIDFALENSTNILVNFFLFFFPFVYERQMKKQSVE